MKKLLVVIFALLFGTISFSRIAQSTEFIIDGDQIDVTTGDVVIVPPDDNLVDDVADDQTDASIDDVADDETDDSIDDVADDETDDSIDDIADVPITVYVDIKPGSRKNPINVKSKGVFTVAILGVEDFDATDIDPLTVQLAGVAPLRSSIEDVSHPLNMENCEDYGVDGYDDLVLKFDTQEIVEVLNQAADEDVEDGDEFELFLKGTLRGETGTDIEGKDTILIIKKGKKKRKY